MEKLIESIDSLDKEKARKLKRIMETTFGPIARDFQENDEVREEMCDIVEWIICAAKNRIRKLAEREVEDNIN